IDPLTKPRPLQPPGTASFCVAASAAEKRDYEGSFSFRQQYFLLSLKNLFTSRPLVSTAALVRKRGGES
ncbi:hypothetical protein, partial [Paraburkholderia sp. GAS333]|uniref:hypothetical protein n=1 Tax=Paraburkholderia sp. GAS333 TaxID=3156279 RepID=UPI003D1CFFCE